MIEIYLHDDPTTSEPGAGPQGPTHMGTARVEYPYQAEEWIHEIERTRDEHFDFCVRVHVPSLGREWRRAKAGERFVEVQS